MTYRVLILSALLLISRPIPSQEAHESGGHEHGSHPECPLPKRAQDVVLCARENHPNVRRARLHVDRAEAQPAVASQIPNPELDVQSVWGRADRGPQMQSQISLVQPLQIGGRRGARTQQARAQARVAGSDVAIAQADVTLQTVGYLHRLRQLEREKEIVAESLATYRKLIRRHRERPALTPEQQVSLGTLELAESDYHLKETALADEERQIAHYFHVSTGHSLTELSKVLPAAPKQWPAVDKKPLSSASPEVHRLQQEREVALSALSLARATSWPEIKLGPMLMLDKDGDFNRRLFGAQLLMEIPIFQLNGAGREAAHVGVLTSDRAIELQRREESHERSEQLTVYESAVAALRDIATVDSVTRRHRTMERHFMRGVVPSALILEAHRQVLELEKSRHERELTALKALWTLYRIDGKILEATL